MTFIYWEACTKYEIYPENTRLYLYWFRAPEIDQWMMQEFK